MVRASRKSKGQRSRDPARTRRRLMETGAALFAERGYAGVTLERVASRSRINKAMIRYYFGGKRRFYEAILLELFSRASARLREAGSQGRRAPERLARFVRAMGDLHEEAPHMSAMVLREMLSGGRRLDRSVVPFLGAILEHLRSILEQGAREGSLRPVDPFLTHLALVGATAFFFATAAARERIIRTGALPVPVPAPGAYIRHVQDVILRGIVTRPRTERAG